MILTRLYSIGRSFLRFPLRFHHSLSARFFTFTMISFALGTALAIIPPLNNYRVGWLEARLAAAHLASLSLILSPARKIPKSLQIKLLKETGVIAIAIIDDQTSIFALPSQPSPAFAETINPTKENILTGLSRSAKILLFGGGNVVKLTGTIQAAPQAAPARRIEIFINDGDLRKDMIAYGYMILRRALMIALALGLFLFAVTHYLFIRPLQKLSQNMSSFQENPEDSANIIIPRKGMDEICEAEYALANMQTTIKLALHQKTRLAGLGLAVSKINHDLRNILSSAQLIADRLAENQNPAVSSAALRLVSSLGRAIDLCTRSLEYGRTEGRQPNPQKISLRPVVEDVANAIKLPEHGIIQWVNEIPPDLQIWADYEYVFRILLNLGRNAVQALEKNKEEDENPRRGRITISATCADDFAHIGVRDTGHGLSLRARANLFMPFKGSTKTGKSSKQAGFGLGLPIARELARASGGDLTVGETSTQGTLFRFTLPTKKMKAED